MKASAGWCGGWCRGRAEAVRPVVSDHRRPRIPPGRQEAELTPPTSVDLSLYSLLPAFVSADTEGSGRLGVCVVCGVCRCVVCGEVSVVRGAYFIPSVAAVRISVFYLPRCLLAL